MFLQKYLGKKFKKGMSCSRFTRIQSSGQYIPEGIFITHTQAERREMVYVKQIFRLKKENMYQPVVKLNTQTATACS